MHLVAQKASRGVAFQTLFSTTDKLWHDSVRKVVNFGFTMSTLVQYEAYVDDAITVFLQQMESHFSDKSGSEGVVDVSKWLHFFTDDTITCITYGKRIGHMEVREDVGTILGAMDKILAYSNVVGGLPFAVQGGLFPKERRSGNGLF